MNWVKYKLVSTVIYTVCSHKLMAFKTLKPGLMFLNILQRSKIVFKKTDSYKQDFPNDLFVDAHPQAILSN